MVARVRKAVITAAGRGTRQYPASTTVQKEMFPLVDRDGITKPTIQIIAEEALDSGIEQLCIITAPGDADSYRRHFQGLTTELLPAFAGKEWALEASRKLGRLQEAITYATQESPEGFGHAVYQARDFVGDEPFLLLLGDHVYVSEHPHNLRCARQCIDVFGQYGVTTSAVKRTDEDLLHLFGTVGGTRVAADPAVYEVGSLVEKPTPEYAEAHLRVEGLRRGQYLCFFGMHVFTPAIFDCLEYNIAHDLRQKGEIQLTSAQDLLRQRERYMAVEALGERYDMGVPFGLVETQLALTLHSPAREEMLASLIRILAGQGRHGPRAHLATS